jgi:hypothetical protein
MSFIFLVEVQSFPPKFLSKLGTSTNQVDIFESIKKDVVFTGAHKDPIYNSKLEKCQELDCTQFYSSGLVTGAISLCAECEPYITRSGDGDRVNDSCNAYKLLDSINFTPPQDIKVTNQGSTSSTNYNTWKTSNGFLSRSGYWLGLDPCGGGGGDDEWSCIVNCQTGVVAGCWNISSGSGNFGDTYDIGGSTYQVYDPIQLALAGLTSNGGSLPLLSSNPLSSGTQGNGNCGTPITIIPAGGGGGEDSNCLSGSAGSCPDNSYSPEPSGDAFSEAVAVFGDYSGSIISTGLNCYNYGGSLTVETNKYALGGSASGLAPQNPSDVGITGSSNSCGECIGQNLSDSYGENGPSCCQLARGDVGINGAPITSDGGSTWSSGSGSWGDFWPTDDHDDGFRTNSNVWGTCGATKATSIYSVPCSPTQRCKVGSNDGIGVIEIIIPNNSLECNCRDGIYLPGTGCSNGSPVKYCSDDCVFGVEPIVEIGCPPAKKIYTTFANDTDCSFVSPCTGYQTIFGNNGCTFKAPVTYDKFFTCPFLTNDSDEQDTNNLKTITKILTFSADSENSCDDVGLDLCASVGNVTNYTVTGITSTKCWNATAKPDEKSPCPENGTYTGFFNSSVLGTWLGRGSKNDTSDPENPQTIEFNGGTCCAPLIQTPWEPSLNDAGYPWRTQTCDNPYNVNNETWSNSTFSESNCAWSDPCDSC